MGSTPSSEDAEATARLTHAERTALDAMLLPEQKLASIFQERTGIFISPGILRMILRSKLFPIISKLAHEIHDGNP